MHQSRSLSLCSSYLGIDLAPDRMLAQSLLAFFAFACVNAAAIEKRALPTPVSAATARTYLTQRTSFALLQEQS